MKRFLLLFLPAFPIFVNAGDNHFLVEISPGFGAGWWVYNKGTTRGELKYNLGSDYTHLSALVSFNGTFFYQRKKWKVGAGAGYSLLLDNVMFASGSGRTHSKTYYIAGESVKFVTYFGQVEYSLFSKRKFSLSPFVKLGSFQINSTHPERENFGRKLLWEAGFTNQIELGKGFSFIIQPKYFQMNIFPEVKKADKEIHGIYSFGLNVGVRYLVK